MTCKVCHQVNCTESFHDRNEHIPTLGEALDHYGEAYVTRAVNSHEVLLSALREAEVLLTNYLVDGKFPRGSDCDEVKEIIEKAIAKAEGK